MLSQILFDEGPWRIGRFRIDIDHACFDAPDYIDRDLVVFPGEPLGIQQEGRDWVETDRCIVMEYPAGTTYRRRTVTGVGDDCIWFQFPREQLFAAQEPPLSGNEDAMNLGGYRLCPSGAFFAKERLVASLTSGRVTPGAVLQDVKDILRAILHGGNPRPPAYLAPPSCEEASGHLAVAARSLVLHRYREPLSLEDIAEELGCSPFHLCRVFTTGTGQTLHRYRMRLRLRAAAEAVRAGENSLTDLAFSLGFTSHSHLTAAFRQEFGLPPSSLRPR